MKSQLAIHLSAATPGLDPEVAGGSILFKNAQHRLRRRQP